MTCEMGVEGVHEDHCLHDLRRGEGIKPESKRERANPGQVCCWCGDLFLDRFDHNEHGEYEPGIAPSVKAKREAAGRVEARRTLRENEEHARSYGSESGFLSDQEVANLKRVVAWPKPKRRLNHICPECGKPKTKPVVCRECKR